MKEHLDADLNSVHKRLAAQWLAAQWYLRDSGGVAQLGERDAGSVEVAGSNPVISTKTSRQYEPEGRDQSLARLDASHADEFIRQALLSDIVGA